MISDLKSKGIPSVESLKTVNAGCRQRPKRRQAFTHGSGIKLEQEHIHLKKYNKNKDTVIIEALNQVGEVHFVLLWLRVSYEFAFSSEKKKYKLDNVDP